MTKLVAKNISLSVEDKIILDNVSAAFKPASLNLILGQNGSGKTQFLKALLNLVEYRGSFAYGSTSVNEMNNLDRAKLMCWLPTHVDLPFEFSSFDVVMMGRFASHDGNPQPRDFKICHQWLAELGLSHFEKRSYNSLSKGEQTKIQLARCIASECKIVILDEICANLDIRATIELLSFLRIHALEFDKTIILSHHDIHSVSKFADHLICLKNGRLIAEGTQEKVFTEQVLKECYDLPIKIIVHDTTKLVLPG